MNDVATRSDGFEMRPRNLEEAMTFAKMLSESLFVPKTYQGRPADIMCAMQMGAELGLTPMRSLLSIAVINGRPSMYGDAILAMVLASPVCDYVDESESTDTVGVCRTKRKGGREQVSRFSLDDAKRAGLLGKPGPWQTNTPRMLKLRARGFGVRDTFADVLANLVSAEEAIDTPPQAQVFADEPHPPHPMPSLKEKLKAQVMEPAQDMVQGDNGLSGEQSLTIGLQSQDAPAPHQAEHEPGYGLEKFPGVEREIPAHTHQPPPIMTGPEPPAAPAFIWRIGKAHAAESIATIPREYLMWYVANGKPGDHLDEAKRELARRG